jgi:hypothetical protein
VKHSALLVLVSLLLVASATQADSPLLLSYQGVLANEAGQAVPDGPYSITFRIYEIENGGSSLWEETHATVQVSKGIFSEVLGNSVAFPANIFDRTLYMGISVAGGDELAPRTVLTATPYTVNAYQVRGYQNIFPGSGNVGIGILTPYYPLHIASSSQVGITFDGSDPAYASIYVNAMGANAIPGYGYERDGGVLRAYTGLDTTNEWFLDVAGEPRIRVMPSGNVCIGDLTPAEKLHVAGGILLGNTASANAGAMRWTGSDFEGYDGATWKSFTSAGSGSLPPGSSGNTLRHDGANWVATNGLYNNGADIGIGTTSPQASLHIEGDDVVEEILVNETNAFYSSSIRAKTSGGAYDHLAITKYGPSAGGNVGGIPLTNLAELDAGINGGPLLLRVGSNNPLYFMTNNVQRMRLTANGNLGINTTNPEAKLHVDGNMWDLNNTEGDFKIGNDTYRLKFGVATGGGGAGTAGIRVAGGAQKLVLGAGLEEVLSITTSGVEIGSPSSNGSLRLFNSGVATSMMRAATGDQGGVLDFYDEAGNTFAYIEADGDGEGGLIRVLRSTNQIGFGVDGNYGGTHSTLVSISGTSSSSFNMSLTGNSSVSLPTDAIGSAEILNEPGAVSYTEGSAGVDLTPTLATCGSQTIDVPASGYVLVIATAQASINHTLATTSTLEFGVSDVATSLPINQDIALQVSQNAPSGTYVFPVTVHGLFSANTGLHTYYLLGRATASNGIALDTQFTCIYIPTAYGTIEPTTVATGPGPTDDEARPARAIDVAAQRVASLAANNERIQREVEELRAEIEAMKEAMKNN